MKRLVCEICESTDLIKQDGVFVCRSCGCKYSAEEVRKMMTENNNDVNNDTVSFDSVDKIRDMKNMYQLSLGLMATAKTEENFNNIAEAFDLLDDFEDSRRLSIECRQRAKEARKESIYLKAVEKTKLNDVSSLSSAIELFNQIPERIDSAEWIYACQKKIEVIKLRNVLEQLKYKRIAKRL